MDKADSEQVGVFNGVRIMLQEHSFYRDGAYWLNITFMVSGRVTPTYRHCHFESVSDSDSES